MLFTVTSLIHLLPLLIQALPAGGSRPKYPEFRPTNFGGYPTCPKYVTVFPQSDIGVYPFQFGHAYTQSWQNFEFYVKYPVSIEAWDCFCSGDKFSILDNGFVIAEDEWSVDEGKCTTFESAAQVCYEAALAGNFEYQSVIVPPGHHNITIGITNTPYGGGVGYIAFNEAVEYDGNWYTVCSGYADESAFTCDYRTINWQQCGLDYECHEHREEDGCHRHRHQHHHGRN